MKLKAIKTYTASTVISLTLPIGNKGGYKHISFEPVTTGSVFVTDDKDLQDALENDRRFGALYKLSAQVKQETTVNPTENTEVNPDLSTITVTCLEDAVEYLVDKFGISRTKLKDIDSVLSAAKTNGITFEGI